MEIWEKARTMAEEAAKRSQEITKGYSSSKLSGLVSEAAKLSLDFASEASKKSFEIASEASKKADLLRAEALRRADQIKLHIPNAPSSFDSPGVVSASAAHSDSELERFGVTDDLREFVKGITSNTFRDFPLLDDSEVSDIPTVSNVRQDLTEWQEKHAKIVLSTVKEISKLRYELCPRSMKERKFWRIYFILVNSHVTPYEKRYNEEAMLKSTEEVKDEKIKEISSNEKLIKSEAAAMNQKSKSTSANEQDLDVFLLGDLGDSDEGPDDGNRDFDDDFD